MLRLVALVVVVGAVMGSATCTGPEAYRIPDGTDYRGFVNVTVSGIPCQSWSSNTPHHISVTVPDVYKGLGDHNYCRNPFGDPSPGCFTMDESVSYELCSVDPVCPDPIEPVTQSVTLDPSSGTIVEGSFIGLQCLPKPCDMYVAMGDNIPSAQVTKESIVVPGGSDSLTLIVTALFPDGNWKTSRVVYIVTPSPQDASIALLPSADAIFTAPVLVELVGGDGLTRSVFFGDSPIAIPYTQPFWVFATTTITAVVGDTLVKKTYVIQTSVRLPNFYPTSGVFVGSVQLTMVPSVTREVFFYRTNDTASWTQVPEGNTVSIAARGKTSIYVYSTSIDMGTSEVSNGTVIIVAPTAPECYPPPGTYVGVTAVSCQVGDIVLVDRICVTKMGSTENCAYLGSARLDSIGVFNVSALAGDGFGSQLSASYTYTIIPKNLPAPIPTVCDGVFSGPLLVGAAVEGEQNITLSIIGEVGRIESMGGSPAQWVLHPTSTSEATYTYTFIATPWSELVSVPATPTTCTVTIFPSSPGKWTPSLRTDAPINATDMVSSLSQGNTSALEVIPLPRGGVLVRAWAHTSLVAIYMRRLWDVLSELGDVRSEVGSIPVAPTVGQQLNRTTLLQCAAICQSTFATYPSCTCLGGNGSADVVFEVVPSFSATLAVVEGGAFPIGSPAHVVLSSLGDTSVRRELTVVDQRFQCEAVGSPLEMVSEDIYMASIVFTGDYKVCADDGSGIFEVPFLDNASLTITHERPDAVSMSPCGGVGTGEVAIAVSGPLDAAVVSVNGREWDASSGVVTISMDAAAQQIVSVVTHGHVQGARHVVGSQSCLFLRTPEAVDMSGALFTVVQAQIQGDSYAISLRLSGLPTAAAQSLLQVWVTAEESCSTTVPTTASYMSMDWVAEPATFAATIDTPQYMLANSSAVWSVCLSVNGAVRVTPQDLHLSVLNIEAAHLTPLCNCTSGTYCTNVTAPIECLCVVDHLLVSCDTVAPAPADSAPNPLISIGILAGIAVAIGAAVVIRRSMRTREPSSV